MSIFGILPRLAALVLAGAALFAPSLALAQAPPAVPALPDTERRTSFSITSQTGPFSVGFALYGDSTDYAQWVQVYLCTSAVLNPCSQLTAVTDWTLSSATGSLASIPRPITDATITLTTARTGTLQIVGARRPRRTSQFAENRGVAARDLNQVITDLVAENRETWDRSLRTIQAQPGEIVSPLQKASTRAGGILCWDATGLIPLTCAAGSSGTANVVGPNTSVVGHIAVFNNTSGTLLADGGLIGAGDFIGPGSSTVNHAVTFADGTGKLGKDSGLTLTPSTGIITLANAKTLAVSNTITLAGIDGKGLTLNASGTLTGGDGFALSIAANKTATFNNTLTFTGTDATSFAFPSSSDTVATLAATQTLTNKSMTAPTIVGGTVNALTSFSLANSGFNQIIAPAGAITANRTLSLNMNDGDRTLSLAGNLTVATNGGTLAFGAASKTLTVNNSLGLSGTDGKTLTLTNGLTVAGNDGTLSFGAASKTLAVNNTLTLAGTDGTTLTFQGTDTYVGRATTDTLTNKTLTAPTINGGTHTAITNLGIRSTGTGAFDLSLVNVENLTAGRTLTLTVNNAARTLSLSGNITTASDFTTAGANTLTLTTTTPTNVTLPASGTLATQNTANTFSATNTFTAVQQFTDVKFSSGKLYPTADSTTAMQFCKADGTTCYGTLDTTNQTATFSKIKFTTLDGASLQASPSTITDMTINNSPNGSTDYIPYYNASVGAWRRGTVNAIATAATAGVSSLNGLTGGLSVVAGTGISVSAGGSSVTVAMNPTTISNFLSGNTALNNATFTDGPSVAQGTSGTWFCSGTITITDTAATQFVLAKLYDGTTTIASSVGQVPGANLDSTITLSGILTSPAGNIRIAAKSQAAATSSMRFNDSGASKDSGVTCHRLS